MPIQQCRPGRRYLIRWWGPALLIAALPGCGEASGEGGPGEISQEVAASGFRLKNKKAKKCLSASDAGGEAVALAPCSDRDRKQRFLPLKSCVHDFDKAHPKWHFECGRLRNAQTKKCLTVVDGRVALGSCGKQGSVAVCWNAAAKWTTINVLHKLCLAQDGTRVLAKKCKRQRLAARDWRRF